MRELNACEVRRLNQLLIRLFELNATFAVSATETVDLGSTFDSNVAFLMCRT